jgi:hypothetical protein
LYNWVCRGQQTLTEGFREQLLRKTFGPKTDELTANWRKLQNEERIDFNSSPYIIRVINSMTTRNEGHMEGMGEKRNT